MLFFLEGGGYTFPEKVKYYSQPPAKAKYTPWGQYPNYSRKECLQCMILLQDKVMKNHIPILREMIAKYLQLTDLHWEKRARSDWKRNQYNYQNTYIRCNDCGKKFKRQWRGYCRCQSCAYKKEIEKGYF